MNPQQEYALLETRRYFLGRCAAGIGSMALASLLEPEVVQAPRRLRSSPPANLLACCRRCTIGRPPNG